MRPLDSHFNNRVRETSLGLGAVMFLALLGHPNPYVPLCFLVGLGVSLLMWRGAQALGETLTADRLKLSGYLRLGGIYLGRYLLAGLVLWGLNATGQFDFLAFTGGFALVTVVVTLKALAWMVLPEQLDPAPIYSRDRKADPR